MLKSKKIMSMLLVICLIVMTLVSCTGNGDEVDKPDTTSKTTATPGNSNEGEEPVDEFAEHLEIDWMCYNQFDHPIEEGTETQKLIEERFNVSLKIPTLDIHNQEQLNLFWAEGNTADRIQTNSGRNYQKLVDQGLLRPISEEMAYEYAPKWMEKVTSMVPIETVRAQLTYQGEFWGLPLTNSAQSQQPGIMAIREDWMENLDITEPPNTIEEFEELIRRFTEDDPDGNGENDTYGFHAGPSYGLTYISGAFGVARNAWYEEGGEIIYANTTDAYKEMLRTLNSWYEKGYMDPEFVTDDRATQRSKWSDGQFGILFDNPWWFDRATPDNVSDLILNKDQNAKLKFAEPFKGPDGKTGSLLGFPQVIGNAVYFGKDASDEVVKRLLTIQETLVTDQEWYYRITYGIEGEHYTINDEGLIVRDPDILTAQKVSELGLMQSFGLAPQTLEDSYTNIGKADRPQYEMSINITPVFTGAAFVTSGPNETANTKGADVTTIADEFYFDAITGRIDIDAEWDAYINKLNSMGLQEIIEEYKELLVK